MHNEESPEATRQLVRMGRMLARNGPEAKILNQGPVIYRRKRGLTRIWFIEVAGYLGPEKKTTIGWRDRTGETEQDREQVWYRPRAGWLNAEELAEWRKKKGALAPWRSS